MTANPIQASKALYIKLGQKGAWEEECIKRDQTLRVGFNDISHSLCLQGKWDDVRQEYLKLGVAPGVATGFANQLCSFYEADDTVLWMTFFGERLYWCFSEPTVTVLPDNCRIRPAKQAWRSDDQLGRPLDKSLLSGKLTSVEGYKGGICSVREFDYLMRRINGIVPQDVQEAIDARAALQKAITALIQDLHPKDFEILVDLIFRQAGWQRVGRLGETEKTLDLDLLSPITSERYGVQVKSTADRALFERYQELFADMQGYTRFYFVVHSPAPNLSAVTTQPGDDVELMLPHDLARLVAQYGLIDWVIDKTS